MPFFFHSNSNTSEELSLEAMVKLLATGELLVALGEDFGKNESSALKKLLHNKSKQFLQRLVHTVIFAR